MVKKMAQKIKVGKKCKNLVVFFENGDRAEITLGNAGWVDATVFTAKFPDNWSYASANGLSATIIQKSEGKITSVVTGCMGEISRITEKDQHREVYRGN